MTSIVVGNAGTGAGQGLGLQGTSLTQQNGLGPTGNAAVGGQGRDQSYVNVADGNLVVQSQDEFLSSIGIDDALLQTYNSQGSADGDNNDGWRLSVSRNLVGLPSSGTSTTTTFSRIGADGHQANFVYNALFAYGSGIYSDGSANHTYTAGTGAWVNVSDPGVNEYVTFTGGVWVFHEGNTGVTETYSSAALTRGNLLAMTDQNGNTFYYTTSGGVVTQVKDSSGQTVVLTYSSTGKRLASLTATILTPGATVGTQTQVVVNVQYSYDSSNRLQTVQVQLASGAVFTTQYTYVGATNRVSQIAQSDGSVLNVAYQFTGGAYKVQTLTDGLGRVTTFDYTTAGQTTVRDALNNPTVYHFDSSNRLTQLDEPPINGTVNSIQYQYDTNGNVKQVTDADGRNVYYTYDGHDNSTLIQDSVGNTITRTYDAKDHLQTETRFLSPVTSGAAPPYAPPTATSTNSVTSYYVYDGNENLTFVISPQGRVTQYGYDSKGERNRTTVFTSASYTVASYGTAPSLSTMQTWATAQNPAQTERTDVTYDLTGQIATVTTYGSISSGGVTSNPNVTHYIYNAFGQLLIKADADTSATTSGQPHVTAYTYDGMGRVLTVTNGANQTTTYSYPTDTLPSPGTTATGQNASITVTAANGLVTTTVYDADGETLSVSQSSTTGVVYGTTNYFYDADGHRVMAVDPLGNRTIYVYDSRGRQVGVISPQLELTEALYNNDNQVIGAIQRAGVVQANAVSSYLSAAISNHFISTPLTLAGVDPGASPQDIKTYSYYDTASRLVYTIDAVGTVTGSTYDTAGRLLSKTLYNTPIGTPPTSGKASDVLVTTSSQDLTTRYYYDNDGLQTGTLDPAGYLTQTVYDPAGQVQKTIRYANAPTIPGGSSAATATLAQLISWITLAPASDQTSWALYDNQGRTVASIDPDGYLTQFIYDNAGNKTQQTLYTNAVSYNGTQTLSSLLTLASVPSSDLSQGWTYDGLNRVSQHTDGVGTITKYTYDAASHVLTQTVDPTGLNLLTKYSYDALENVTSVTDPVGSVTQTVYDADSRVAYTIDAVGDVTGYQYDADGRVTQTTKYATPINVSLLPANPTPADVSLAAVASTLVNYTPGASGGSALSAVTTYPSGNPDSITPDPTNQRLVLNSSGNGSYSAVGGNPRSVAPLGSVVFHSEITLTSLGGGSFYIGANGTTPDGTQTMMLTASFAGNVLTAYEVNAGQSSRVSMVTLSATGTYVTEVVVTATGATLYVYQKGQSRASGWSTSMGGNWGQAWSYMQSNTAASTNYTAYVGNLEDYQALSGTTSSAANEVTRSVYNAAGEVAYTIDAVGDVTGYAYDQDGRVTQTTKYATPINPNLLSPNATPWDVQVVMAANTATSNDFKTSFGQLTPTSSWSSAPSTVAVTNGTLVLQDTNLVSSAYPGLTGPGITFPLSGGASKQGFSYVVNTGTQVAGEPFTFGAESTDNGSTNEIVLNIDGGTVKSYAIVGGVAQAYSTLWSVTANTNYVIQVEVSATSATIYIYQAGQPRSSGKSYTVAANWTNVKGVIGTTQYSGFTSTATMTVSSYVEYQVDTSGNPIVPAITSNEVTRTVYDALGRVAYAIDAMGDVTGYQYDADSRVMSTTKYATAISLSNLPPALTAANGGLSPLENFSGGISNYLMAVSGQSSGIVADAANQRLVLTSSGGGGSTIARSPRIYNVPTSGTQVFQMNFTPVTAGGSYYVGISSYPGSGEFDAHFAGGQISVFTNPVGGSGSLTGALASYTAGTTYVVEIDVTSAGATLYVYQQGQSRSNSLVTSTLTTNWTTVRTLFQENGDNGNEVAYVSNVIEPSLLTLSSQDETTRNVYDAAGRVAYAIDAMGYVTGYQYDQDGRVTQTTKYAMQVNVSTAASMSQSALLTALNSTGFTDTFNGTWPGSYQLTGTGITQDTANNRLVLSCPTSNGSTGYSALVSSRQYAITASTPEVFQTTFTPTTTTGEFYVGVNGASGVGAMLAHFKNGQLYAYTGSGDGTPLVNGNYTAGVAYVVEVDVTSTGSTLYVYSQFQTRSTGWSYSSAYNWTTARTFMQANGNSNAVAYVSNLIEAPLLVRSSTQDETTRDFYDAGGRMIEEDSPQVAIFSIGTTAGVPSGGGTVATAPIVTKIVYDANGNVTERIENATAAGGTPSRVTSYRYDALGRQIRTINADTYTSGSTTYGSGVGVYNGTADSNTASYNYGSNLDLTNNTNPTSLLSSTRTNFETTQSLKSDTIYDGQGNAIVGRDAAGNYSYKIYDALGRVSYEIDADRQVTQYGYDAFGNQTVLTHYSLKLNTTDSTTGVAGTLPSLESTLSGYLNGGATLGSATVVSAAMTAQAKAAALAKLLVSDTSSRAINTMYDQINRKTQVKQPAVNYFYTNGTNNYGVSAVAVNPETDYQYDAFGDVILQKSLQYRTNATDPNTGAWVTSYFGYDAVGHQTDQIDPMGYYTQNTYDAFGRLIQNYEYAAATSAPTVLTAGDWNFTAPTPISPSASGPSTNNPIGYDRITQYGYDALDRQISVTRVNTQYSTASNPTGVVVGNTTTTKTYDAVGNVIATTDEEGNVTRMYYDALGRLTATATPTRTVQAANATVSLRSTNFSYSLSTNGSGQTSLNASWNSLSRWGTGDVLLTISVSGPVNYTFDLTAAQGDSGVSNVTPIGTNITVTRITVQKWLNSTSSFVTLYDTGTVGSGLPSSNGWGMTEIGDIPSNASSVQLQYTNSTTGATGTLAFAAKGGGFWQAAVPNSTQMPAGSYSFQITAKDSGGNVINLNQLGVGRTGALQGTMTVSRPNGQTVNFQSVTDTASTVTPFTTMGYDALGNMVSESHWANGVGYAGTTGWWGVTADAANDQITYQRFDILGHVLETVDANGNSEFKSYDAFGHVDRVWSMQTDNSVQIIINNGSFGSYRTQKITTYAYDAVGQQTATTYVRRNPGDAASTYTLDRFTSTYNAFGEAILSYVNGLQYQYANYDSNGRVWQGSDKNGISNLYGYDLLGNQTVQVVEPSAIPVSSLPTTNPLAVTGRLTESVRDKLGRVVEQLQPKFTTDSIITGSSVSTTAAAYGGYGVVEGVNATGILQFKLDQGNSFLPPTFYFRSVGGTTFNQFSPTHTPGTNIWTYATPATGQYEYNVVLTDGQTFVTYTYYGTFTVASTNGPVTYGTTSTAIQALTQQVITPTVYQTFDRWGNALTVTDPRSASQGTRYSYNDRNQVISKGPLESYYAYDSINTSQLVNPSYSYYDDRGEQIASKDAYSNVSKRVYDADGELIQEIDALNQPKLHVYDALGQEIQTEDASGNATINGYDRLNHLTISYSQSYLWFQNLQNYSYRYDESGNQTLASDGQFTYLGRAEATRYRYDTRGNILMELSPLSMVSVNGGQDLTSQFRKYYSYDAQGNRTTQNNNDGHYEGWGYDLYGRVLTHFDFSGTSYTYHYTAYGQLSTLTSGAHPQYGTATAYSQNLGYTYYDNGLLRVITDYGNDTDTYYEYDAAGNKLHEEFTYFQYNGSTFSSIGTVQQNDWETYDTQGLQTSVRDNQSYIRYTYDANGNRREVKSWFELTPFGSVTSPDGLYAYDANNRMTIEYGQFVNGGIFATTSQGAAISYDAVGNRTLQMKYEIVSGSNSAWITRSYLYDPTARLLSSTYHNGGQIAFPVIGAQDTSRTYDNAGRVIDYATYDGTVPLVSFGSVGGVTTWASASHKLSDQTTAYNLNGWTLEQRTYDGNGALQYAIAYAPNDGGGKWITGDPTPGPNTNGWYDGVGNVSRYEYHQGSSYNSYTYYYSLYDSYQVSEIDATSSDGGSGSTKESYDGNGILYLTSDTWNPTLKMRYFLSNAQGQTLERSDTDNNNNVTSTYYFYANGKQIASAGGGAAPSVEDYYYTPISSEYPQTSPSQYVVQSSDLTAGLEGIASQAYGDASLWYLIADANGVSDGELKAGMLLTIPNKVTNLHNNASTFKPYNASEIVGNTTPTIKPPPPSSNHSGGIGAIIAEVVVIVVTAIVTYFTAGATSDLLVEEFSYFGESMAAEAAIGAAATVAGAAVGAAIGSVAGQLTGMALGVQKDFSWSRVGTAAIDGAVTAGFGGGSTGNIFEDVGLAVAKSALTQGVNMAIGQQKSFSWAGVASSAVSAGLQFAETGGSATAQPGFALQTANGFVAGSINMALSNHGHIEFASVAADAFANALGNAIVGQIQFNGAVKNLSSGAKEAYDNRVAMGDSPSDALRYAQEFQSVEAPISGPTLSDAPSVAPPTADDLALPDDALPSTPDLNIAQGPTSSDLIERQKELDAWAQMRSVQDSGGDFVSKGAVKQDFSILSDPTNAKAFVDNQYEPILTDLVNNFKERFSLTVEVTGAYGMGGRATDKYSPSEGLSTELGLAEGNGVDAAATANFDIIKGGPITENAPVFSKFSVMGGEGVGGGISLTFLDGNLYTVTLSAGLVEGASITNTLGHSFPINGFSKKSGE